MFGSRHPAVAAETNVLAVFLVEHGRNREAEACYRQSMEIWERTLGPYSPELASGLNNLAILLFMEDRPGCVRRRPRSGVRMCAALWCVWRWRGLYVNVAMVVSDSS